MWNNRLTSNIGSFERKHSAAHLSSCFDPSPNPALFKVTINEQDVRKAIISFPNGSAGSPDGLRPQHLKDLTGPSAMEGGQLLLSALCPLIYLILSGKTPPSICPHFFSASLVALRKKNGGIRPIAAGCMLRRLAAKCAVFFALQSTPELLAPRQLGFRVAHGVGVAAHATRVVHDNLQSNEAIVKEDFENAFNCIRQDKLLAAVEEFIPELLPFVHSVYGVPSLLWWGEDEVHSSEGMQQGDPLRPL